MHVLGLDVGWSLVRRSSAACLLSWTDAEVSASIVRFTADPAVYRPALTALVGGRVLAAAAFDGPLRGDLEEIGLYRLAEKLMTGGLARHIGKPGQTNSPNGRLLNRAASGYARDLLALAEVGASAHAAAIHAQAIAEAFPTSFLGCMLDAGFREPGKARSDSYYLRLTGDPRGDRLAGLIARLLPGRALRFAPADLRNHDDRAALVCAATALCIARRSYVAVGDDHGRIILPPRAAGDAPGLQDWAWTILAAGAAAAGAPIIVETGPSLPDRAGAR
ncbi:MAG: hypothetical protein ACFCVH_00155 [Alphaproteobacteria bacterium]